MPKVSVIIPVYNSEKYLPRCLDSIVNQTLEDIEIICVNDCSTDNSLKIIQEYAQTDKRIKFLNLPQNVGAGKTRNIGIDNASAKYIGFVDSDDFIDIDFYEKLYEKAIENNADVVKGNIKTYDNLTKTSKTEEWLDINYLVKKNKAYFCFTFTTAIYKNKFIKENHLHFLENFIHFEDPYFTIMSALLYKKIAIIDDTYYYYCNNSNSASRNPTQTHVICQVKGAILILEQLNKIQPPKEHYIIVVKYLISQLVFWCNITNCQASITKIATDGLSSILKKCNYLDDVLFFYFNSKKEIVRRTFTKKLRKRIMENKNA